MKNTIKSIFAAVAATFAVSAFATAPSDIVQYVPDMMNYQGYLANPSTGAAYTDGIYELDIRLYRSQTGGTAIWGGRYSVYVKGGYFNIMLGDSNASRIYSTTSNSSYPTYGITELRRALWNDTSVSQNYNLWLGVTPRQGPTHAAIASPTEIAPRQQLLAAPYAFRTMSAKYAEAAYGDFAVGGKLTVSGSMQFPSSYSFNGVSYSSSAMKLAGTSQTSSNPSLYLYGNYMYLYPYGKVEIKPQAGNIEMSVGSGYSTKISGGTFSVNSPTIKLEGTGPASLKTTGGNLTLRSSLNTFLESEGADVYILAQTNKCVLGKGEVRWMAPYSGYYKSPIKLKKVTVTVASGGVSAYVDFATRGSVDYSSYVWSVAGFRANSAVETGLRQCYCQYDGDSGYWRLWVCQAKGVSGSTSWTVELLGTHKSLTDDAR